MADFDPDAFLAQANGAEPAAAPPSAPGSAFDPDAFLAQVAPAQPSTWDRIKQGAADYGHRAVESTKNLARTAGNAVTGAVELASPIDRNGGLHVPFSDLMDPAYRHQVERGLSDTVTGGLAERAANAVDPGFAAAAPSEAAARPGARDLGAVAGSALPSPFNAMGGAAARAIPGTGVLPAAARGLAGYEASAVPAAVVQAPEGHRLDAALNAATDPAGLALGAGGAAAAEAAPQAKSLMAERAQRRMAEQAIKDVAGSRETGLSKPTDRRFIANAADQLREEFRDPEAVKIADTARKDPARAWELVQKRVDNITQDRAASYAAVDQATGGVNVKEFRRFLEDKATELSRDPGQKQERGAIEAIIKDLDDSWGSQLNPSVPTIKFRQLVTRYQTKAADTVGGLNETQGYKINAMVAGVAKDFLDRNLDVATKMDPGLRPVVDGLKDINRRASAWLSLEDALKTRASKMETNRLVSTATKVGGLSVATGAVAGIHSLAHNPVATAATLAAGAAPYVVPPVDRAVTRSLAGMQPTAVSPAAVARLVQLARAGNAEAQQQLQAMGR